MGVDESYFAQALAWSIRSDFGFVKWLTDNRSFPESAISNQLTRVLYRAAAKSYAKMAPRNIVPTLDDVIVELSQIADDEIAQIWGKKIGSMEKPSVSQGREIANRIAEQHDRGMVVSVVEQWLTDIGSSKKSIYKEFSSMSDHIVGVLVGDRKTGRPKDVLEAAWSKGSREPESTGYSRLDVALDGGWRPANLILWGMPSGHGKTSTCCNFASRRAEVGKPTLLNSLEMPAADLLFRMISDIAQVPINMAENPEGAAQTLEDYERIMLARDLLDATVRVYDTPADHLEIDRRLRRHRVEFQDEVILAIVDHIGIIRRGGRGNEWAELESMAYSLSNVAKKHEIPLLAYSQVPQEVELELLNNNVIVYNKDFRGSRGLRNAIDVGIMGSKHTGLVKNDSGDFVYDNAYKNHTIIQMTKNRRTGKQFWGVFEFDPMYYRLLNTKTPGTKDDIYG